MRKDDAERISLSSTTRAQDLSSWWALLPGVLDLMRIGGFVQLKRLTRIHPGRRSFAKHRI